MVIGFGRGAALPRRVLDQPGEATVVSGFSSLDGAGGKVLSWDA
jgi:hypothetical protein